MLVERLISPGLLLQAGATPCFTVADISQMWVMANVFESDLTSIEVGDAAEIVTSASAKGIPGEVDNISAIIDPNTRSLGVRVVAKNPDGVLKKQMYVRVLIHSNRESTGLLVPVTAVLRNDENLPFIYVAGADGTFERRGVTLGSRMDDKQEITSGLKEDVIRLWSTAACLFNFYKTSERRATSTTVESSAPDGFGHAPDCGVVAAAAISRDADDGLAEWCGLVVAEPAAGGRLSGPVAADG